MANNINSFSCFRPMYLMCIGGVVFSSVAQSANKPTPKANSKQPNIIFLLTDDHRYDALGAMGNTIIKTPNIDQLAHKGTMFTNAYATTPISCSSRASVLTGQYASRHGVHDFNTDLSDSGFEQSYPMVLKNAGYKVGFIGKYGIGLKNQPRDMFDFWTGELKHQPDYDNKDKFGNYYHHTDQMGREIGQFLDNFSSGQDPFCLSVSFKAPHTQDGDPREFITHQRYDKLYSDVTIPTAMFGEDRYWDQFPEFFKVKNEARKRWRARFDTPEKYQKNVKNYYRLISQIDDVVGDMTHQLRRLGVADNTIIIFMGDNGFFLGEHGMAGKWFIYNESIRIPMIIYNPQSPQSERGRKVSSMVLNIDIAPTMLALAGIEPPVTMQGKSVFESINPKQPWRTDFFYEHRLPTDIIPKSEGVVSDNYKYVVYYEQTPVYEELFDLKSDPNEIKNVVDDPKYSTILQKNRTRLAQLKKEALSPAIPNNNIYSVNALASFRNKYSN